MDKIEVAILNPESIADSQRMMITGAKLTQRGHKIKNMSDFMGIYNISPKKEIVSNLVSLPHPTIQKLGVINVVVVGASRRFLAQITRHQNEVKFVSASLQYSDYSDNGDFCVPYDIIEMGSDAIEEYLSINRSAMQAYKDGVEAGLDNDAAGYLAPQGLRNVLIISATPYQWIHMIRQRTCRRNTKETRFVMLLIWEQLFKCSPEWFEIAGPFCTRGPCEEKRFCCKNPLGSYPKPSDILKTDFPLIYKCKEG